MIPGTAISTAEIARAIGSGAAVLRGAILSLPPQLAKASQGATVSGVVSENLDNGQVRIATSVGNIEISIGRAIPVGQQVSVRIHPWSESVTSSTNYPSMIPDRGDRKSGDAASGHAAVGSAGNDRAASPAPPLSTAALTAILEAVNAGSADELAGKSAALADPAKAAASPSDHPSNRTVSPHSDVAAALLRRLTGGSDIGATIAAASFLAVARHQERKASHGEPARLTEPADHAADQSGRMNASIPGGMDRSEKPAPASANLELARVFVGDLAGPLIARVQRDEVPPETPDDDTTVEVGTRIVFELNLRHMGRAEIEVFSIGRNLQLIVRSEFNVPGADREQMVRGIGPIFDEFSMYGICRFEQLRHKDSGRAIVSR